MTDPIFTLTSTNPFGICNVGNFASPAFVDIDGDGDMDVFTGYGYYGYSYFLLKPRKSMRMV